MSNNCCCQKKPKVVIKVTSVTVNATQTQLVTTYDLSTLVSDQRLIIAVDPLILPVNGLPVVLTNTVDTIPLTMPNGNVMRENVFEPFCHCLAHCNCCAGDVFVPCFFGADSAHIVVLMKKKLI